MSISINGGSPFGGVQSSGPIQGAGLRQDKDGDHDASSRVSGPNRSGLMQNVVQSLNSLGLSSPTQVISPTNGQEAQQAMHSFMHSLHQALQQAGGQTSTANNAKPQSRNNQAGNNADAQTNAINAQNNAALKNAQAAYGNDKNSTAAYAIQSIYGSLDGNLQSLLSNVKSNSSNPTVSDLSSKFANLVQTLKGGQSTGNSQPTNPTDLQSFLQDMIQNSRNPLDATGLGSSGNLLSIRA